MRGGWVGLCITTPMGISNLPTPPNEFYSKANLDYCWNMPFSVHDLDYSVLSACGIFPFPRMLLWPHTGNPPSPGPAPLRSVI